MIHPQYAPAVRAIGNYRAARSTGSWPLGHSRDADAATRRQAPAREPRLACETPISAAEWAEPTLPETTF